METAFEEMMKKNEELANSPTTTKGWSADGKIYTDETGMKWGYTNSERSDLLYNEYGINYLDWQRDVNNINDPVMPVWEGAQSTPKVSTTIPTASAAPSGYGEYLAGEGKAAQAAYDQAIADARAEYARNRATFGQQAEQLGRAGLTGSGYGDYLEGKAFSAMQNTVGAAEVAKAQSYADYLTQKEAQASSYAAYLAGEEEAAKEKMTLAVNGAIANALNSGSKYVSRDAIAEYAMQNGVTFDDATMAEITSRLAAQGVTVADSATVNNEAGKVAANEIVNAILESGAEEITDEMIAHYASQYGVPVDVESIKSKLTELGVTVKTMSEMRSANIEKLIAEYSDTNVSALTIEGYQNAARRIMPDLTDEELAYMTEQIAARRGEALLTDEQKKTNDETANRATLLEEIKTWAVSSDGIPTVEQIKEQARLLGIDELTEEEMTAISSHVKGLMGRAPVTTEDVVKGTVKAWVTEAMNTADYADSSILEKAMKDNGFTSEEIKVGKAAYYENNYFANDYEIKNWSGSSDGLVAKFGALALNDMIDKTITEELAAELQKQVSAKLDEMFNAAFDSDSADEAQKILGVTFENVDNPGGEIAKMAYEAFESGALDATSFGEMMEKFVEKNINNLGADGPMEDSLAQSVLWVRDLIGEEENKIIRSTYSKILEKYGDFIKSWRIKDGKLEVYWNFDTGTWGRMQNEDHAELVPGEGKAIAKAYRSGEAGFEGIKAPTGTIAINKDGTMYYAIWNNGYNTWYRIDENSNYAYGADEKDRNASAALYLIMKEKIKAEGTEIRGMFFLDANKGYFE